MRFFFTADICWETKVDHAMRVLDLRRFFEHRDYGEDLSGGIGVVAFCHPESLNHKKRLRYKKLSRELSVDLILNYVAFVDATHVHRRELLAEALVSEMSCALDKYRFRRFNAAAFLHDLQHEVGEKLLGPEAARFDHLCLERASGR